MNVHLNVIADVEKAGLTENVSYVSYLPHKEALAALNNSSISLNLSSGLLCGSSKILRTSLRLSDSIKFSNF